MDYTVISADCHIDLIWLPPTLFSDNASQALKQRMPYVEERADGLRWVSRNGADFGLVNAMGSGGRPYVPGVIHRSDRMASTGLYEDGKRGIRRLSDPDLRIKDQDLDGVQGEVLYGILGSSARLNDAEAATEMLYIYNRWLEEFCATHPQRFAGIACVPNDDMDAAVAEVELIGKNGVLRGIEIPCTQDMHALFDSHWHPLWKAAEAANLPVHLHTIGGTKPNFEGLPPLQARQAFAVYLTGFQVAMSRFLMEAIYGGIFEIAPRLKLVFGESGIGWIPYILEHMDLEWEDQFKDLTLTMKPSEYWRRNCYATYQSDRVGVKLLDELGEDNIMWGSDFPHPDGVWPDSQEFIANELAGVPDARRRKIICDNARHLYRFGE
jgi:predicted TIM-barrel fold metal-dependent hydrolase